jgi:phage shock protein PspC (stress-responsive transcriptional regulator)
MSEQTTPVPEARRLERSSTDRMVAGVAGGLARYFDIHPAVFRVGFVVLTLLGGSGILIYAAAAVVMPAEGEDDSIATRALRQRRDRPWPLIGLGLVAVAAAVLLSDASFWSHGDLWLVLLLVGGAILWVTRQGQLEPLSDEEKAAARAAGARDSRRIRHVVGRVATWLAIVLASFVALLLVTAAIAAAVFDVNVGNGISDQVVVPTTVRELDSPYELGIGSLQLDLSQLRLPVGETEVDARVDVGDLLVTVPADAALQVRARVKAGSVRILGEESDGWAVERQLRETGPRVLVLDARVGAGSVRIDRAVP